HPRGSEHGKGNVVRRRDFRSERRSRGLCQEFCHKQSQRLNPHTATMHDTDSKAERWLKALQRWSVWQRGLTLGRGVGLVQAIVNQGDHWVRHEMDAAVVVKTILSPLITFSVALVSAAATHVEKISREDSYEKLEAQS